MLVLPGKSQSDRDYLQRQICLTGQLSKKLLIICELNHMTGISCSGYMSVTCCMKQKCQFYEKQFSIIEAVCNYLFVLVSLFSEMPYSINTARVRFICQACSKTFAQLSMLLKHFESAHVKKRRPYCFCDYTFCDQQLYKKTS